MATLRLCNAINLIKKSRIGYTSEGFRINRTIQNNQPNFEVMIKFNKSYDLAFIAEVTYIVFACLHFSS